MSDGSREVVITGMGVVLPGCDGRETFWRHLRDGDSQLTMEPTPDEPSMLCPMGRIRGFHPDRYLGEFPPRFYERYPRELQIYLASVLLARDDAGLRLEDEVPERIGLFDGSSRSAFEFWYDTITHESVIPRAELYTRRELLSGLPGQTVGVAASLLKVRGPAYLFSGTCSSGAIAVGHAFREIRWGEVDVAIATGHDNALVAPLYAMYRDASLLTREESDPQRAVRPYVDHSTNAFGEGSLSLVLEERRHAEARGAPVLARLTGYGYGNNGYHPTTVDVAGVRPSEIIQQVLGRAGVAADDVAFVVGHGNGVHLSDVSEENYMRRVFGARSSAVPLISTKPIYGHTLGASSMINIAAAALMVRHGYVVPTINIDERRVKRAVHHQPNRGEARPCPAGVAVSYGMGGHNTVVLVEPVPGAAPDAAAEQEG